MSIAEKFGRLNMSDVRTRIEEVIDEWEMYEKELKSEGNHLRACEYRRFRKELEEVLAE